MSGKPNPEGVRQFKEVMSRLRVARDGASHARLALSDAQKTLEHHESAYREAAKELRAMMEEMDIASNGNFGWEGRITWFFAELAEPEPRP